MKIRKIGLRYSHSLKHAELLVISRCCFAEDGDKMYKDLYCTTIVLLSKTFFLNSLLLSLFFVGDVPLEVLTQIVETISDPSAMLGPEVNIQILLLNFLPK